MPRSLTGIACCPRQLLSAYQITDGAHGVNDISSRPQSARMIAPQIVPVPLEHLLAFLERIPVVSGLAKRRCKPLAGIKPVGAFASVDGRKRIGHSP